MRGGPSWPGKSPGRPRATPIPALPLRAGIVVVVVLFVVVAVIFVARNIEHAQELEEHPSPPLPTAGQNG